MSCFDDQNVFVGPANQTQIPASVFNLPSSIAPNASVSSNLIVASGYAKIAVGLTLSQAGTLFIQRYLDAAGTVKLDAGQSVALVAGTPGALTVNDGNVFGAFQVTVTNSAGSTALIVDAAMAVASDPATPSGALAGSYQTPTSTTISVPLTTGGAVVLAENASAKYRLFRAPAANTGKVWLTLGANAAVDAGLLDLAPGEKYEMSVAMGNLYQGTITAIADGGAAQTLLVTEGV
ncbi:MAG: hypothetical protein KGI37_07810 [Alphaproteobacteria bacterium]|nr:hypothetical protein [Alphaproteobacteria bacterium]